MASLEWEFDESSYPVLPEGNWGAGKKKKKKRGSTIFSELQLLTPVKLPRLTGSKRKHLSQDASAGDGPMPAETQHQDAAQTGASPGTKKKAKKKKLVGNSQEQGRGQNPESGQDPEGGQDVKSGKDPKSGRDLISGKDPKSGKDPGGENAANRMPAEGQENGREKKKKKAAQNAPNGTADDATINRSANGVDAHVHDVAANASRQDETYDTQVAKKRKKGQKNTDKLCDPDQVLSPLALTAATMGRGGVKTRNTDTATMGEREDKASRTFQGHGPEAGAADGIEGDGPSRKKKKKNKLHAESPLAGNGEGPGHADKSRLAEPDMQTNGGHGTALTAPVTWNHNGVDQLQVEELTAKGKKKKVGQQQSGQKPVAGKSALQSPSDRAQRAANAPPAAKGSQTPQPSSAPTPLKPSSSSKKQGASKAQEPPHAALSSEKREVSKAEDTSHTARSSNKQEGQKAQESLQAPLALKKQEVSQAQESIQPPLSSKKPAPAKPSLFDKMQERLQGGRFRQLNEMLYTQPGDESLELLQREPDLFEHYHRGFENQTKLWPIQPVDLAIAWLAKQPKAWKVADFGCGDARLGTTVQQDVASLDLVASAPGVTACNMAHTPLGSGSMDAVVFCLSLMGTDYGSFLEEAARVTKNSGWIWVAEVKSRFAQHGDKEDTTPFIAAMRQLGFSLVKQDAKNTMFIVMLFKRKGTTPSRSIRWPTLKACVYKRR